MKSIVNRMQRIIYLIPRTVASSPSDDAKPGRHSFELNRAVTRLSPLSHPPLQLLGIPFYCSDLFFLGGGGGSEFNNISRNMNSVINLPIKSESFFNPLLNIQFRATMN